MKKPLELKLKAGDEAPDFHAAASGGGKVSLSDFRGKKVILYFYPQGRHPGLHEGSLRFPRRVCGVQEERRGRARGQH